MEILGWDRLYHERARGVTFEVMDKICAALDCQPGDLFARVEDPEGWVGVERVKHRWMQAKRSTSGRVLPAGRKHAMLELTGNSPFSGGDDDAAWR
ncbi:MAG: helix-turn-helix transcriptional regulator [Firmicutes bacterium]|nr:helix-turn-helix transcriptional regulator [Bacillota bacterium]